MGASIDFTKKRAAETSIPGEPPCAARCEELVIEACLVVPGMLQRVSPPLVYGHFYMPEYRPIFEAIQELYKEGSESNALSVMNWLRLKKKDGPVKPEMLKTRNEFTANEQGQAVTAAKIVYELAQERSLISLCQETAAKVLSRGIDSHQGTFTEFGEKTTELCRLALRGKDTASGEQALDEALEEIFRADRDPGVLTGIRQVDDNLGAMLLGQYTLIGGSSGDGKTAYALTAGLNVALSGFGVFHVSVADMTKRDLMLRAACNWAAVPARLVMQRRQTQDQNAMLMRCRDKAKGIPLEIDDTPGQSIQEIAAAIPRVKAKFDRRGIQLKLVVIDYLQQVGYISPPKSWNEELRLRQVSQLCKDMAVEHNVHVMGMAQSHPPPPKDKDSDGRPNAFQNCKEMRRPAEIVAFIHRLKDEAGLYPPKGKAELVVRKARWGSRSNIPIVFNGPLTRFEDDPSAYSAEEDNF